MEENRAVHPLGLLEEEFELLHIMAVHGAKIRKSHLLKNRHANQASAQLGLEPMGEAVERRTAGDFPGELPVCLFQAKIAGLEPQELQMPGNGAHIGGDGHAVIIEHHHQRLSALASVVKSFVGKASRQRPIAQNRHHAVILVEQGSRPRHAQRHGNRLRGMSGNKRVVHAL